jgi:hypothetical protein
MAGAVTALLAASALADFKKSRRRMERLPGAQSGISGRPPQSSCQASAGTLPHAASD